MRWWGVTALVVAMPVAAEVTVTTIEIRVGDEPLRASGGLYWDPSGTLHAGDFGPAFGVTDESASAYRIDLDAGEATAVASGLGGASGGAFAPDGTLYQANPHGNRVSRLTADGTFTLDWATGLTTPIGVVVGDDGHVYVANCGDNTIRRFTPDGKGEVFADDELLKCPNGLAKGDDGMLYVSNYSDGRILSVDPAGAVREIAELPVLTGGPQPVGNGHLAYHDDAVYVATVGLGQVFRVDVNGKVTHLAGRGFAQSNVDGPGLESTFVKANGIAVADDGTIYVMCSEPGWPSLKLHDTRLRMITID